MRLGLGALLGVPFGKPSAVLAGHIAARALDSAMPRIAPAPALRVARCLLGWRDAVPGSKSSPSLARRWRVVPLASLRPGGRKEASSVAALRVHHSQRPSQARRIHAPGFDQAGRPWPALGATQDTSPKVKSTANPRTPPSLAAAAVRPPGPAGRYPAVRPEVAAFLGRSLGFEFRFLGST